jgi:hypothetical protein
MTGEDALSDSASKLTCIMHACCFWREEAIGTWQDRADTSGQAMHPRVAVSTSASHHMLPVTNTGMHSLFFSQAISLVS